MGLRGILQDGPPDCLARYLRARSRIYFSLNRQILRRQIFYVRTELAPASHPCS